MPSKQATVEVNEYGRCTIPIEVRRALDFDGEEVMVDLTVEYDNELQ